MQDISEDILIKASEGDLKSFEVIYNSMAGFVYNVAFRILNHREDAEEVAQEVFLIVYHQLKGFRFESSFKTWVYRITANCAINYVKKISKIRNRMTTYDDQWVAEPAVDDVTTEIDQEHHAKVVEEFLNAVNPDQRACVVLRNIEGLSYQQIAETLKININTVRSRLKRAREKMMALRKQVEYEQLPKC